MVKLLVTGGAGFIGSHFVKLSLKKNYDVVVIDNLTYAGDLERISTFKDKISFYKVDISDKKKIEEIFEKEKFDYVIHFAAESHVDTSIKNPYVFIKSNILGTQVLLDVSRNNSIKKFLNISTDEVYGELKSSEGKFSEESALKPNSPYSISKCSADLLGQSYYRMYNFPIITIRPSNNYGPWQFPEKLIPLSIKKLLNNEKVQIYGDGKNIREWLYVEDCVEAILSILENGKIGEIYNISSGEEKQNVEVVWKLLDLLVKNESDVIFIEDRLGHDFRYACTSNKLFTDLNWKPKVSFEEGIKKTVIWYKNNVDWINSKEKTS